MPKDQQIDLEEAIASTLPPYDLLQEQSRAQFMKDLKAKFRSRLEGQAFSTKRQRDCATIELFAGAAFYADLRGDKHMSEWLTKHFFLACMRGKEIADE